MRSLPAARILVLLAILVSCNLLIYFLNKGLLTEQMRFEDLLRTADESQALKLLEKRGKPLVIFFEYSLQLLGLLLRLGFITACISIGCLLFNVNYNISGVFSGILTADFSHLLSPIVKLLWFSIFAEVNDAQDLDNFSMLSITDIINPSVDHPYYLIFRSFRSLNLYEFIFCCVLTFQIKCFLGIQSATATKVVFVSYFSVLLLVSMFRLFVAAWVL
jgi:hypothetical protein